MDKETFYSELIRLEENNKNQIRPFQILDVEIKDIELPYEIEYETQLLWKLQYINFINSTISSSKFSGITFEKIEFFGRSFLEESQFINCKFENTNIVAWFNNTYSECEFNNCEIDLSSYKSNNKINSFKNCSFKRCKICINDLNEFSNCIFEDSFLNKLIINNKSSENEFKFVKCEIDALDFVQEDIIGFHFTNCLIKNKFVAIFNKTIDKCTFNGLYLSIHNCKGKSLNFDKSILSISKSDLIDCSFRGSKVSANDSNLESGNFYNSDVGILSKCVLENSTFLMSNLKKAKINECDLNNVDFTDILLESNINGQSYIDNLLFIQISTNIIGFNKLTYCPKLKKLFLKFETDYIPKEAHELDSLNYAFRKYEIDFFREYPLDNSSSAQTLTLTTTPEDFILLINTFFINGDISQDPLVALKIALRGSGGLDYKLVEIPNNHFKKIGKELINSILFLRTFSDDLYD
jgi:uncharacterized protein YjbI with pentapeptide repeats